MNHVLLLTIITCSAILGSRFTLWRTSTQGSIFSGILLLIISSLLGILGEHPLIFSREPIEFFGLAVGLYLGVNFPCCSPGKAGIPAILSMFIVFFHGLLDGHVVREASNIWLIFLLIAHKFQDGADASLFSGRSLTTRKFWKLLIISATPIGFLFLPQEIVNETLHNSLLAIVIGLNLGSGYHLLKRGFFPHSHDKA